MLAVALWMQAPHRITSFEHVNQEVVLKCDAGVLIVRACADNIVQVRYYPRSARAALPRWGVGAPSAAVKYRVDSTPEALTLSTAQLTVNVDRKSAQVSFLDAKQNPLLSSLQIRLEEFEENSYRIHAEFSASDGEGYYGLGQHSSGALDQRGKTVQLSHDSTPDGDTIAIPFLVTNRKYGLIFDNPSKGTVVPGKEGVTAWDAQAGAALSYYFIYGNTTDEIYRGYRLLTGPAALPRRAALGYIQGVPESYGQEDVLKLALRYREKKFPLDVLAINSGGKQLVGPRWPDPAAMNAELGKFGTATAITVSPFVSPGSPHLETLTTMACIAKDKDGKPGNDPRGSLIDLSRPSCATWFWNDLQEHFLAAGFSGFWLAGAQPDLVAGSLSLDVAAGALIYNYFPALPAKSIYEGYRKDMKDRPLILSRFAYLGAQQYATQFGPVENAAQWSTLASQVPAGLNFTASGMAWWASALGGAPGKSDDYAELYSRWLEFSAFCPSFRMQVPVPENEAAEKAAAKYLGLRARLLPYIFSLARNVTETGAPLMRALFMDFPQDPEVHDIKDEYMFGPAILAAPVTQKGKVTRDVYLPKGPAWYDYWTGKKLAGGQVITAEAPADTIPLYVRAGSIIPHTIEREVEAWVYTGADAQFDLYEGDATPAIPLRWTESTQRLSGPFKLKTIR